MHVCTRISNLGAQAKHFILYLLIVLQIKLTFCFINLLFYCTDHVATTKHPTCAECVVAQKQPFCHHGPAPAVTAGVIIIHLEPAPTSHLGPALLRPLSAEACRSPCYPTSCRAPPEEGFSFTTTIDEESLKERH